MTWLVVHFLDNDEVEVVPKNWYKEATKKCSWPPYKSSAKTAAAIKSKAISNSDWQEERVRVLGKYDKFDIAHKKCQKAKDTDNLSSYAEVVKLGKGCRKRKRPQRLEDDDTTTDNNESSDEISCPRVPLAVQKSSLNSSRRKSEEIPASHSIIQRSITGLDVLKEQCAGNSMILNESSLRDRSRSENPKKDSDQFAVATHNKENNSIDDSVDELLQHIRSVGDKGRDSKDTSPDLNRNLRSHMRQEEEFRKLVLRELYLHNCRITTLTDSIDGFILEKKKRLTDTKHDARHDRPAISILEKCPIQTPKDLEEIERFLKAPEHVEILIRDLNRLGGSNVNEVTKRMCYAVMDDAVAVTYSWDGAKGKKKFRELRLAASITKAVLSNQRFLSTTEHDITKVIKSWLVGAIGRNKKRIEENDQDNTTDVTSVNEDEGSADVLPPATSTCINEKGESCEANITDDLT